MNDLTIVELFLPNKIFLSLQKKLLKHLTGILFCTVRSSINEDRDIIFKGIGASIERRLLKFSGFSLKKLHCVMFRKFT
jgi:hypothetical protein